MTIITKSGLAAELSISAARVSQYLKLGMPERADGRLDRETCLSWIASNIPGDEPGKGASLAAQKVRARSSGTAQSTKVDGLEDRAQLSHAEAVTKKENYLAALKELEYDLAVAQVVEVSAVARHVAQEFATVRSRMMAIPSKVAARAVTLADADEIRALIESEVIGALEELTEAK